MKSPLSLFLFVALILVWASIIAVIQAGTCPGACQPTTYSCSGTYESGLCPGGNDIKCCVESTPNCPGQCQVNTLSCAGTYKSGLCPGPSDVQCCETSTSSSGIYGVDVSDLTTESEFSCLLGKGFNFTIVRGYRSVGQPDTNAPSSIKNAWNAGMKRVDIYMYPCYSCGDPAGQVSDAVSYLKNSKYEAFWFDVEGTWSSDKSSNQQFFESMISEAKKLNQTIGVYTSSSQWSSIMGSSYTGGSAYPLWYAHYQSPPDPSFDDFSAFGGWKSPSMKQYSGDDTDCGVNLDQNWAKSIDYTN